MRFATLFLALTLPTPAVFTAAPPHAHLRHPGRRNARTMLQKLKPR